jgi:hypothetical protein
LQLAKKNPKLAAFLIPVLGIFGYSALKNNSEPQQEAQPTTQPIQAQPTAQPTQTQQPDQQQSQAPTVSPPPNFASEFDEELKQAQTQMLSLFQELDKHRQIYEETAQKYSQANEIYEKQLLGILPTIPLLLAKTPLNNMTGEDLLHHTSTLFSSMPYSTALKSVDGLMKGYYIAKMNGVDPKTLTTTDLLEIAENPVLAKSTDENIAQFLSQIGEVLKYKIKSNLDKIGVVKDSYDLRLKELQEKGKIFKDMVSAIKDRYNFQLGLEKLDITTQIANARNSLWEESIKKKEEIAMIKQQEKNSDKKQGGGKFKLSDDTLNNLVEKYKSAEALIQQNCKNSSGNIDTNCANKYLSQLTPNQ